MTTTTTTKHYTRIVKTVAWGVRCDCGYAAAAADRPTARGLEAAHRREAGLPRRTGRYSVAAK